MSVIYPGKDGVITNSATDTWSNVRNGATGTAVDNTSASDTSALRIEGVSGRSGTTYTIKRSYFYFDVSSITTAVQSATFNLYGLTNTASNAIGVKSTAFGGNGGSNLITADFNNLDFATAYTDAILSWKVSLYNTFTLTATALTDIAANDHFIICVINKTYDNDNSDPGVSAAISSGMYFSEQSGTSNDPYLDITLAPFTNTHLTISSGKMKITTGKFSLS